MRQRKKRRRSRRRKPPGDAKEQEFPKETAQARQERNTHTRTDTHKHRDDDADLPHQPLSIPVREERTSSGGLQARPAAQFGQLGSLPVYNPRDAFPDRIAARPLQPCRRRRPATANHAVAKGHRDNRQSGG